MLKKIILPALGLSCLLAAFAFSTGVLAPSPALQPGRPDAALAFPAAPEEAPRGWPVWATGKVEAWRQATVGAKAGGRIEAFHKKEGDFVRSGEIVASLERHELEAELREARARRDQALRERERSAALKDQGVDSQQTFEQARTEAEVAEAKAAALEARLEDALVRAPFSGRVLKTFGESGESVEAGRPLFVLGDLSALKVRAEVDELDVGRVAAGFAAQVWPDALAGRAFEGRVERLSGMLGSKAQFSEHPQERVDTKVLEAEIRLSAAPGLLPGMNAKVRIEPSR